MRPVNLIPPEDRRGEHAPLRAGAVSYAIVGFLGLALVGVVLMVLAGNDISENESELAALEAQKVQADVAAANLADYEQFATLEHARSETVSSLAQSRFDWARVLNELALVIPRRVTLDNLTATATAGVTVGGEGTAAAPTSGASAGPSLQIGGCAKGQEGTARFLAALRDIDGVTRVGMQSSELGALDAGEAAAASAAAGDSAAGAGAPSADCQTKPQVARFQVTVAFDAVPVPIPPAPAAGTPADVPAPTPEAPATETTGDDGVADASAEQQAATDSANEQVAEAESGAEVVGVDGE